MQERSDRVGGWGLAVGLAAAAVIVHLVQLELIPFVLAAVLGFVLDPPIRWLQGRMGAPRWAVATPLFLLLLFAAAALTIAVGISAGQDLTRMAVSGPAALHEELQKALGPHGVKLFGQDITADSLSAGIEAQAHRLLDPAVLKTLLPPALAVAIGLVLLTLLTFYAMVSGPELARGALWLVPPSRRRALERVLPQMTGVVQRYFIGVIAVVAFTIAMAWIGYGPVLHVKGAALLALAVGLLETVPAVGPIIAAVLVTLAALQLHSLAATAIMIGYAIGLRFAVDDLVAPIVLGKSVTVHPVVVMLAYLLGAVLFGVVGLLLAVPAAACTRIALRAAYDEPAPLSP